MTMKIGPTVGWCQQREKIDWWEACKFDSRLVWTILIFVVPHQFSPDIGEWPENQISIPDWTYFHCPGATLVQQESIKKIISGQCLLKIDKDNGNQEFYFYFLFLANVF